MPSNAIEITMPHTSDSITGASSRSSSITDSSEDLLSPAALSSSLQSGSELRRDTLRHQSSFISTEPAQIPFVSVMLEAHDESSHENTPGDRGESISRHTKLVLSQPGYASQSQSTSAVESPRAISTPHSLYESKPGEERSDAKIPPALTAYPTSKKGDFLNSFCIEGYSMKYSHFLPRLFNLVLSMGFEVGKILPSVSFCSDESQGYPTMIVAKHFSCYPFKHGKVGATISTSLHETYASHGKDLVLLVASHVGYNNETHEFGRCQRWLTEKDAVTSNCGKIAAVLSWYQKEYLFAQSSIWFYRGRSEVSSLSEVSPIYIVIDNVLHDKARSSHDESDCIVVNLDRMLAKDPLREDSFQTVEFRSTSKVFKASDSLVAQLDGLATEKPQPFGRLLLPSLFKFKEKNVSVDKDGGIDQLRANLAQYIPLIVTSEEPLLEAAKVNTMKEFDRAYRSILRSSCFRGRNVLLVGGLNVDHSSTCEQRSLFPGTSFIPYAAYHQKGSHDLDTPDMGFVIEQERLYERLMAQSVQNDFEIAFEALVNKNKNAVDVDIVRRSEGTSGFS